MPTSLVPPDSPLGRTPQPAHEHTANEDRESPAAGISRAELDAAIAEHADADSLSSVYAVARELHLPAPALVAAVTRAGHGVHDGHILPTGLPVPQQIAAALALAGVPLTVDELVERIRPRKAESSVRNALIADDRFVKADRTSWGSAQWGLKPYVPIHRQIANIVDEHGSVTIDRLVADITAQYDVKEHSIRTYASTGDFMMHGDVVTRRTQKYVPRKSPSKTKHLYRDGSVIRWRTTIGPVHRKGSAFNLPSALAALLGVGPAAPREFSSRLGTQSVIWVSVQARCGTIKRFVEDMDLTDGDDVFLRFEDGVFDIERVSVAAATPMRSLVLQVGRSPARRLTPTAALAAVADSLWLDATAQSSDIVDTLKGRRELELAELVRQVAPL